MEIVLPCDTCIIDPMCINACPDFKEYMSKVIIDDFLSIYNYTPARTRRIYNLTINNIEYFVYFSKLLRKRDVEKRNEISLRYLHS